MSLATRSRLAVLSTVSVFALAGGLALGDAASDYETLFGIEAKKVTASGTKTDDAAFAAKLLKAAKEIPDSPILQILLYKKACQFGSAGIAGCDTALEALELLEKAVPNKKPQWRQKKLEVLKLRFDKSYGSAKKAAGEPYMEMLEALADTKVAESNGVEAKVLYSRAMKVATYLKSPRLAEISAKSKRADLLLVQGARLRLVQSKIKSLQNRLAENPKDIVARKELILLYVVERDKPAEAAKLLTEDLDEVTRTYVPLAAKNLDGLAEAICLELGDWYHQTLAKRASSTAKPVILRRAKGYYQQFLESHTAKDAQSYRVKTALKNIDNELTHLDLSVVESGSTTTEKPAREDPGVSLMLAVLKWMPRGLLPDSKGGWNVLTLPKVNEWLAKYCKRKTFRGLLALESCSVRHIKGDKYSTSVVFETVPDAEFTFRNKTMQLRLVSDYLYRHRGYEGSWQTTRKYSTTQSEAEKWQKKPKGKLFNFACQIVSVRLKPISRREEDKAVDYLCLVRVHKVAIVSEYKVRRNIAKKPQPTTRTPSEKAESRIRFAKMYLSSGMKEKAVPILKEVIEKYPNTRAATEAKELLGGAGGK